MRKFALLGSILLLSVMWAVAQYESPSRSTNGNAPETTVDGCLDQSEGTFILTLPSGAIFQLTGNTAPLKAHVGETVRVTGVATPVTHVPGSMSEGEQTYPTIWVSSFHKLSGACAGTNSIPSNLP